MHSGSKSVVEVPSATEPRREIARHWASSPSTKVVFPEWCGPTTATLRTRAISDMAFSLVLRFATPQGRAAVQRRDFVVGLLAAGFLATGFRAAGLSATGLRGAGLTGLGGFDFALALDLAATGRSGRAAAALAGAALAAAGFAGAALTVFTGAALAGAGLPGADRAGADFAGGGF